MQVHKIPVESINNSIGAIDLFICCASYEERSEKIAMELRSNTVGRAIVVENANHRDLHSSRANALIEHFGARAKKADTNTDDPLVTADALSEALTSETEAKRLLIDITTFTHEALLILIRLVYELFPSSEVTYAYMGASDYSTNEQGSRKWLSRGVTEVRSVLGYPGQLVPSRKLHLVLLAGMEQDRATELVRACEPSILSFGYSDTQTPEPNSAADEIRERFSNLRTFFPSAHEFAFDCYSPSNTAAALNAQIGLTHNHNVVIAPMSTKLSTLGAAVVALENDHVQLCYASAALYNHRYYSSPGEHCYLVNGLTADTALAAFHCGKTDSR